ncbi:MAG TPA: YhdP family protein [Methylophilus sp.]|nr:YhdP family protein [Methylophilus sp.]HQQ33290.1 YhdP family protein [Methylophilus sp.]
MIIKSFRWIIRYVSILLTIAAVVVLGIYLALRFYVLPNIHQYKDEIATRISNVAQQKITIGDIRATWDNVNPILAVSQITVYDAEHRPALGFEHIIATLSWKSLSSLQPRLTNLSILSPQLVIRRETNGDIFVAGIPLSGKSNPDLANWLLRQGQINIKDASVIWNDDFRKAPPLSLNKLDFRIDRPLLSRLTGRHEFSLHALPSLGTTHPIEINGQFYGNDVSKTASWHGDIHAKLVDADLSVWKQWLDYPFDLQSGFGSANLSLHFDDNRVDKMQSDVVLSNVSSRLKQQPKLITLNRLTGELSLLRTKNTSTFEAKNIHLTTSNGLDIRQGYLRFATGTSNGKSNMDTTLKLDTVRLESLREFAGYIPIPPEHMLQLESMAPSGQLSRLDARWKGDQTSTQAYSISTQFSELSLNAYGNIPGISKLTGSLKANEKRGTLTLDSKQATLDLKDILRWPIPLDTVKGDIHWQNSDDSTVITTDSLNLANPHLAGKVTAGFTHHPTNGDYLELEGSFGKGNAKFAPFYYPIILGKPTLHWLDTSILSGKAEDIKVIVKGKLADFPYVNANNQLDTKKGLFRVTAKISDVELEYGIGWPNIQGLGLDMLFEGKRMELNVNKGHIFRNQIIKSKTTIPQLDADSPMLLISSEVTGPVEDGVRFVNESPVKLVTQGFTDTLKTSGQGKLLLDLKIPMQDLDASKYKGVYTVSNGTIFADKEIGLPQLNRINGMLNFTESSLSAENIRAEILGGPAQFTLKASADKTIHIAANGRVSDIGIKQEISHPLLAKLQGNTDWTGEVHIKKPQMDMTFRSSLNGLAIKLPAPIGKTAEQTLPFSLIKKQTSETQDSIQINYGNSISGILWRQLHDNHAELERGDIAINTPAQSPSEKGLTVRGKLEELDADAWIEALNNGSSSNKGNVLPIQKADFFIQKLTLYDRQLNNLNITGKPNNNSIDMTISSKEINGDVAWLSEGSGKIIARLKQLTIPSAQGNYQAPSESKEIRRQDKSYPALDVVAESFQIGDKQLGKLTLNAYENEEDWVIQKLNISNSDSTLDADGVWQNWARRPSTNIKFSLVADNAGKALKRFGQPDMVKGGEAEMSGQLQWPGSPHEFDASALSGNFTLVAKKGQILKVQPGVGRLLGLLSLQSLPRRLTLDFRDLFSDGFAFDKISATAQINNGVLRSNDFFMTGPAAEAQIKGETNLKTETQNLNIKVVPHVSDSLSLAALAGGPIAGAAAFVAQKILKDPLNKIASSEYVIIGTWSNPQEVKSDKDEGKPKNNNPLQ